MTVVPLLLELGSGHRDLLRVDDDDEVARIDVRRVFGLPFPTKGVGDAHGEAAERLALRVDDVPAPFDLLVLGVPGPHRKRRTPSPPSADCSNPSRNSTAPPWDGWRTYEPPRTPCARRPTATTRRPWASSSRNGRPPSTSALTGRRT